MFNYWWLEYFIRISSGGSRAVDNAQCLFWPLSVYLHRHETMQEHFFQMQAKHLIKWSFKCWLIIELWGNKRHALGNFRFLEQPLFLKPSMNNNVQFTFSKILHFWPFSCGKIKVPIFQAKKGHVFEDLDVIHQYHIAWISNCNIKTDIYTHIDCVFIFWRLFSEFYCCKWQKK